MSTPAFRSAERGSAIILALLITVIMTLLGVSYLIMAETENRIAQNERFAAQALFFAEAAAREAESWFNSPYSGTTLVDPTPGVMDRTLRLVDEDGDPGTPPHPQDGSTWPRYKQNVDLDSDGVDDVLRPPYRGTTRHALQGTEDGPDVRIDEKGTQAARDFLRDLSDKLLPDFPAAHVGIRARVTRIDIYAPPYVNLGGTWTRAGMGTVMVVARVYQDVAGSRAILAERSVKAVLNEVPYGSVFAPLHSGNTLDFNQPLTAHWGPVTVLGQGDLHDDLNMIPASHPREIPARMDRDRLWAWNDDARFAAYKEAVEGMAVEDPWFRYLGGGPILDVVEPDVQPYPFSWDPPDPVTNPLSSADDHSGVFQKLQTANFPVFEYDFWKSLATSGRSEVRYFVWEDGSAFKENGRGTARTFWELTDGEAGLFFFDTVDGLVPRDEDADGVFDNLSPTISLGGGSWDVTGFLYLNSEEFRAQGMTGRAGVFNAPGEPFQDRNDNGEWDAGENWVNLYYPTTLAGSFVAVADDKLQDDGTQGVSAVRNRWGPDVPASASVWGILYNNGRFNSSGDAVYYGSVLARAGVVESSGALNGPSIYWDARIPVDWPPHGWNLPRVAVTQWEAD